MKTIKEVLFTILLVCSLGTISFAQQAATATLSGRVLDPNGAVIPGATVTATQKGTAAKREATTNDEGIVVIPNLPAGELGVSNVNYSGFTNVLVCDSSDPASAGFLRSSSFGLPVTTAGGVFGSGGPRAVQFAARVIF